MLDAVADALRGCARPCRQPSRAAAARHARAVAGR
jgi:hypothetical protein